MGGQQDIYALGLSTVAIPAGRPAQPDLPESVAYHESATGEMTTFFDETGLPGA